VCAEHRRNWLGLLGRQPANLVPARSAFATAKAGIAVMKDLNSRLGPVQPIHDKYDRDTNHGLNTGPQAAWTAALANARLPTNTLLGSLSAAGLFP
jgi:hypothetical protein